MLLSSLSLPHVESIISRLDELEICIKIRASSAAGASHLKKETFSREQPGVLSSRTYGVTRTE